MTSGSSKNWVIYEKICIIFAKKYSYAFLPICVTRIFFESKYWSVQLVHFTANCFWLGEERRCLLAGIVEGQSSHRLRSYMALKLRPYVTFSSEVKWIEITLSDEGKGKCKPMSISCNGHLRRGQASHLVGLLGVVLWGVWDDVPRA
jgi:hypothetical protein